MQTLPSVTSADFSTLRRARIVLLGLLLLSALPAHAALTLAAKNKSEYQIVVATNAPPSEQYAATELRDYIEKISGVPLPIVSDGSPSKAREILLGDNAHLRALRNQIDFPSLGQEGYILRTDGKRLIIAGGQPRGTLYGVYALLENHLGVRWFTPEVESVPATNRILLPTLNVRYLPTLQYREVYWTEMMRAPKFAARHRLNGNSYALTEQLGSRAEVYFPFVHSLDSLIPRELYHDHPEYFPLRNGKRIDGYVQRCLSNPDVIKMAIARVRQWIQEHPNATIISVSQNDTGNWCQCPQCKGLDDAEGSPSASMLRFVNTIAQDIEHDYPNVRLDTLAYQYTRKPPKTIRPRPNVIIRLCSIECCFAHPLATCVSDQNRRFRDDIVAWQPIAPTLYVWDYTPNFAHYQQPFPNLAALQPNVQFFASHGVRGLFEQGNYSSGGNGELGPLRAYLLAQLLWDPNTDLKRHTTEFLHGYYGQAAPKLQAYLDLLTAQVQDPSIHARISDRPTARYLNPEFLKSADTLFDDAAQLAETDAIRARVETAHLPIWYVEIAANRVTGDDRDKLVTRFLQVARRAGINQISEGQSLDDWAKKLGH